MHVEGQLADDLPVAGDVAGVGQVVAQVLQGGDELLDGLAGRELREFPQAGVAGDDLALVGQLQALEERRLLSAPAPT